MKLDIKGKNKKTSELTARQIIAINKAAKLGQILQLEFPQIADDYREGISYSKIAEKYNILTKFGVSLEVAKRAIGAAITGYGGGPKIKPYTGLITNSSELEKLCREHKTVEGIKRYKERKGIFGLSKDEMKKSCSKGGKTASRKICEERKGIFGLSKDEMKESGRKSAKARGYTPYIEGNLYDEKGIHIGCYIPEKQFIFWLSQLKEFRYQEGTYKGMAKRKLIAERINELYHNGKPVRTIGTISAILTTLKKS